MTNFAARLERELARPRRPRSVVWTRRILLALLLLLTPLVVAEIVLRVYGYYRPRIPLETQSRTNAASVKALNHRFGTNAFIPDQFLLWKLRPGTNIEGNVVGKDGLVESSSVVDAPVRAPEKATTVLVLGDSTALAAYRAFPGIASHLVSMGLEDVHIRVINAAVAGYTTEQALRWFGKLKGTPANVVVICLGWNDMFPALNLPDKELGARNAFFALTNRLFRQTRLYQFLAAPSDERFRRFTTDSLALRVGPDDYRKNLEELISQVSTSGARPVLATQPENLSPASASFLAETRFVESPTEFLNLRKQYNAITRSVAARTETPLIDIEEEFMRRNRDLLFEADGIHLSPPGHNFVARLLVGMMRNLKLITEEQFQQIVQIARYDTTAPDRPRISWSVTPAQVQATTGSAVRLSVLAKNSGNTTLLRRSNLRQFGLEKDVSYGAVSLTGRWKSTNAPTTDTVATARLSHDLLPRESTSMTLSFQPPPEPGGYLMELGMTADRLGDLKRFGAETTTVTVTVTP